MALSKLKAINMCLGGVGLSPVASEDNSGIDALAAGIIVDQITSDLQLKSWWFNTERDWNLTPDATTGRVAVPSNVTDMITYNASSRSELAIRGDFIYDSFSHTFNLLPIVNSDDRICFTFLLSLDFAEIPEAAKTWIAYASKRMYTADKDGDTVTLREQREDALKAWGELQVMNLKHKNLNVFDSATGTDTVLRAGGTNSIPDLPNALRRSD